MVRLEHKIQMSSTAKPKHSRQFSLRELMIVMTIICLFLALPGGFILVGLILTWATLQAAILWLLSDIQKPLYRILSGERITRKSQ